MRLQHEICDRRPRAVFKSVSTGADIKRSAHSRTVDPPGFLVAFTPWRKSFGALKFTPKEAYIGKLVNGRLYINAASYYHDLPGEQGNSLEESLAYGTGIYASWLLLFFRMLTARESDIVDST